MTQIIQSEKIRLYDLEKKFKLRLSDDKQFFTEWQENIPKLSEIEKQQLERVKASYLNLTKRPMLEDMVKMVVLSPLLNCAGFYLPPFYSTSESSVEICDEDEGVIIRGKIDVLVLQDQLWIVVIESKQAGFSLEVGIPQALAYMLANPKPDKPVFGLVTNGGNFIFMKMIRGEEPIYALSDEFTLRRGDDLYIVLRILKRLGQLFV
ncbi:MAG: restriction endonuclease subunit R [Calothrix sp. MO_192.B10]|nr:restriction endonuclease subunit R [Calothrix sp. MO_192.B10]